ncbi:MAG: hypothetical protein HY033_08885 [Ignavibacteriae bacterium]|nr:hypothetical protein [Ignavibacteria bacterium]MBI3365006.1 hypothetical protein [Ignavibacteriota bacterium]
MPHRIKLFLIGLVGTLVVSSGVSSQTIADSDRNSLGLRIGYSFSMGDWTKVRKVPSLPEVNLFKEQITFGADLEFRLSDRLTLSLDGGYEQLDGSEWEAYTRTTGDTVSVTASFGYAGILLRPYLKISKPDIIRVEVGLVMLFASGNEITDGRLYNYDFFGSVRFGGEGGIEYDRMLGDNIAASLRVAGIFVPSGVEYGEGESRAVIALPVTLGIRFYY